MVHHDSSSDRTLVLRASPLEMLHRGFDAAEDNHLMARYSLVVKPDPGWLAVVHLLRHSLPFGLLLIEWMQFGVLFANDVSP